MLVKVIFDQTKPTRLMRTPSKEISFRDGYFTFKLVYDTLDVISIPANKTDGSELPPLKEQLEYIKSLGMTKAYQFRIKTQ
jgi:CDP-diacylglycerol pyrophosphatase